MTFLTVLSMLYIIAIFYNYPLFSVLLKSFYQPFTYIQMLFALFIHAAPAAVRPDL